MTTVTTQHEKHAWDAYIARELSSVRPALSRRGFSLSREQPHILGERYLQQAVTTEHGRKLILLGQRTSDGKRVVIKVTREKAGAREIAHERACRTALSDIGFAYQTFFSPRELLSVRESGFTVFIQEFIEAPPFLERPVAEQFAIALSAFKAQESAHATTYRHHRFIEKTFGKKDAADYLRSYDAFRARVVAALPDDTTLRETLGRGRAFLRKHTDTVEQYGDFLTHTDFVPHNFRVAKDRIYLLDHSSIRFGNKHEGWARFINFMELYNPALAEALVVYVRSNRASEELLSLKLMRIYRLGEIIYYYTETLSKSSGNLHTLNRARVGFWSAVLKHVLLDTPVPETLVAEYKKKRDALRSPDEKKRQVGLH